MFREVKRTLRCGGHAASGGFHSGLMGLGRAGMLQVAGVFLDGLAEFPVKDRLLLFRAADFLRVVGSVPK